MQISLEVLFTPVEFEALAARDLSRSVCVVFDILRATTSMVTALANGATAVVPVAGISEALELRRHRPEALLAGERNGVRIRAEAAAGVDFDLGNSPREFTPDRVGGRTIVMTTTNGTRALRACAGARAVLVGSFLNLRATVACAQALAPSKLLAVCGGTLEQASFEDALAAGALCDLVWATFEEGQIADSALMARELFLRERDSLPAALGRSRNGRRLLGHPDLKEDVAYCGRRDTVNFAVRLDPQGVARALPQQAR